MKLSRAQIAALYGMRKAFPQDSWLEVEPVAHAPVDEVATVVVSEPRNGNRVWLLTPQGASHKLGEDMKP